MPIKSKVVTEEKDKLHPNSKHRQRYNFPELIKCTPHLSTFVRRNEFDDLSIDFKNAEAVKTLNKALLKQFYGVEHWSIPQGYLCPPIPGRADYLHYAADLLAENNKGVIPKGENVKVLDIGVGANCIYPLVGHSEYGWSFVGSDVDHLAIQSATSIVKANNLSEVISIRKQSSAKQIFTGVIDAKEKFDLTISNPPFHASLKEAGAGTNKKWNNLGKPQSGNLLNFGGKNVEIWYEGGEELFIKRMITESVDFAKQCLWFTTLVSKKDTLPACYKALKAAGALDVKTINMAQGQKASRILAWTFLSLEEQQIWR